MSGDPYGARALRDAVLAAWSTSPARFREDANAEEDHARGYYRDRVVVELAQNAADAASRLGEPGALLLRLTTSCDGGGTLVAANTGSPLDADGVASLSSLRASAKRDDAAVGRFGVGFAAVRSVADEIAVLSAPGAVHFSVRGTLDVLAAAEGALAAEVARRGSGLPALRLPFEGPGPLVGVAPEGWSTVVVLGLRDRAAVEEVRRQLAEVADPLLLALPGLDRVQVEVDGDRRVVQDVRDRWVVVTRSGHLDPELLADRPVEERGRTGWEVTWAVRRAAGKERAAGNDRFEEDGRTTAAVPTPVVHAPTPTDEPCTVPALLIGTFPLDPSRRHVAPGPVTDALVDRAAAVWTDLLGACRQGRDDGAPDPLDLLPGGLPAGRLDARLRDAVLAATREVAVLEPVDGGRPLIPAEALVLDGPVGQDATVLAALSPWLANLVAVAPRHRGTVIGLGVVPVRLADLVETLPGADAAQVLPLYRAFADVDATTLEELATLPVPLADGRVVRGARGLLVPDGLPAAVSRTLSGWGLRLVHPDAAHGLLDRLGATRADAAAVLRRPELRDRVLDDEDGAAEVLLELVAALVRAGSVMAPEPWWPEVLLAAEDGELLPARGLVLPGSPAERWLDPEVLPAVAGDVVDRWGLALPAVGVRVGLAVEHLGAEALDPDPPDDVALVTAGLDGWEEYRDHVDPTGSGGLGQVEAEVTVVADLDAVLEQAWPEVLVELSRGPARRAFVELVGDVRAPSYTSWWLRRHAPGLGRPFVLPGSATSGAGLLADPPPHVAGLDVEVLRALGGVTGPAELDRDGWAAVLDTLPATGEPVGHALAVPLWRGLAAFAAREPEAVLNADRLPALVASAAATTTATDPVAMVAAEQVAVCTPMWAQHPAARPAVVVPAGQTVLADVLDLDLAQDRLDGRVTSRGESRPVPDVVGAVIPGLPRTWVEHEDLRVDGERVDWWVDADAVHAATARGLAHGLAQVAGWAHRHRIERLLTDPDARDDVLMDLVTEEDRTGGAR